MKLYTLRLKQDQDLRVELLKFAKWRRALLITSLCIVFVIGCIGETIDSLGTVTVSSDLIGAGILVLISLPVILLLILVSRKWLNSPNKVETA